MNELELIREFRSEVPEPDASTTAVARAVVMEAVARADRRPAPRRARRRWPFALVATAGAAAATLLVVVLQSGSPPSAAAAVLQRTARAAAEQPATAPPRPGQFVYTKSRSLNQSTWVGAGPGHDHTFSVLARQEREAWIGTDGSGRLRETSGASQFMSDRDRAAWIAAGRPNLSEQKSMDQSFSRGGLSYLDLSKLPTDAAALKTAIEQRKIEGGPPGDGETFTIVGDLLRETYASPQLRAALYQVASELPGVQLVGTAKDEAGRSGIAVGYAKTGTRHDLIFDPKTSALLAERTVQAGNVVTWTLYLASGVVDSTSATS